MKWYIRHPVTRIFFGYALQTPLMLAYGFTLTTLFQTIALPNFINYAAWGMSLFLILKNYFQAKVQTHDFDSTSTGKHISAIIKKICKRNKLTVPYRALEDLDLGSTEKWEAAHAQSFPYRETIVISTELYNKYKEKKISQQHLESILAHELGHLNNGHTLLGFGTVLPILANIAMYFCFAVSAVYCLQLGFGALFFSSTLSIEALTLLGNLQLSQCAFYAIHKTSEITANIISRGIETEANLSACEYTSPKKIYNFYREQAQSKKAKTLLKYYHSWLERQPTPKESADDIALFYPQVKRSLRYR